MNIEQEKCKPDNRDLLKTCRAVLGYRGPCHDSIVSTTKVNLQFLSTPVRIHGGLIYIALRLSVT